MKKLCALYFLCLALWQGQIAVAAEVSGKAKVLGVSEAVREALERNPEVATLRERLKVMQARAKQASYLEDPELVLQAMGVPLANPFDLGKSDNNTIGIRQKFPFFGKLGLKEKIAMQEAAMAEAQLRAKEREIVSKVKTTYADTFMARKMVGILREQLEIIRSIAKATEARYQVGKVTQQDIFKSLLEQSTLMNQLVVAEEEAKALAVRLNALLSRDVKTPIEVSPELEIRDPSLTTANLEQTGLSHRPELTEAERGLERAERMYELADRNRKFPDFMLGWDYSRMPTDMTRNRYQAMVNITVPFSPWTIGRRNQEVEEALAEIRAAKANREAMRNVTLMEIGEASAKVRAARQSVELYREGLLSQAELSLSAAMSAYQNGRVEFASLLEAQRALRETRMGYYRAQVSLTQSVADLERAMGQEIP